MILSVLTMCQTVQAETVPLVVAAAADYDDGASRSAILFPFFVTVTVAQSLLCNL